MRSTTRLIALAVTTTLVAVACGDGGHPTAGEGSGRPGEATVVRVIDGDTIVVNIGGTTERVRLIGIDTPETSHPRRPVQCFGAEASIRTKALLPPGTSVLLVRDAELRDAYDRLLAYVHRTSDDLFVNLDLVRSGHAAVATYPPNVAHVDEISSAASAARRAGRGLWSACGGPDRPVE